MLDALDILKTYRTETANLSADQIGWLRSKGVTPQAIGGDPDLMGYALTAGNVVFDEDAPLFDFASERPGVVAAPAIIILARGNFGDEADLVAWSPRSGRLAAWLGSASMLGEQNALAARLADPALDVHESPLAWLIAGRRGVCIIDPRRARHTLECAQPLRAASVRHGLSLRRAMTLATPNIVISRKAA